MTEKDRKYVHGYSEYEACRLNDQARTLDHLLHHDTLFPAGARVLEAGCGTGAQTGILCRMNPDIRLTSVDISADSLEMASRRCQASGSSTIEFIQADICDLPFDRGSFDFVFVCFVLEHLPDVEQALRSLKRVLKPGGGIVVIEGDHGSAYFYPQSELAGKTIDCLVRLQAEKGGDALIGRRLYPLLAGNGFNDIQVSPRMVYADASLPEMVEGFTKKTFAAMVEGVRDETLQKGLMSEPEWNRGISELYRTAATDGVFCYTFFKATARI